MIAAIRRAFAAAITPPPVNGKPISDAPVFVGSYARRKPVNAKREALHAQLRAELGR